MIWYIFNSLEDFEFRFISALIMICAIFFRYCTNRSIKLELRFFVRSAEAGTITQKKIANLLLRNCKGIVSLFLKVSPFASFPNYSD